MTSQSSIWQADAQTARVLELMADSGIPPMNQLTPEQARENMRAGRVNDMDPPGVGAIHDETVPGRAGRIPVRCYHPGDHGGDAALLYFHGGGFVIGDLDTHDVICRYLCAQAGTRVISVDYRLAPEHRYPAAVEDALDAYQWLRESASALGIDPTRLSVGGDSAGGALAAVVAQQARDDGVDLAAQLLIYPVTDLGGDYVSESEFAATPPISRPVLDWFWELYFGSPDSSDPRRVHPWASPIRAQRFDGLAPAFVLTAGLDPLRDQGAAYAARLSEASVETVYQCAQGTIHGFLRLGKHLGSAQYSLAAMAAFLHSRLRPATG
jgi:acetyl esterase